MYVKGRNYSDMEADNIISIYFEALISEAIVRGNIRGIATELAEIIKFVFDF